MGAMNEFLRQLETPAIRAHYDRLDDTWNNRREAFNARMVAEDLPLRADNMSSVWTLSYTQAASYNWMMQFYLRDHGLALSWVGTGRLIFSLNFTQADFEQVLERFVQAGHQMKRDGWWWSAPGVTNKAIRRRVLKEVMGQLLRK
jgi:glutamate-1-semialdehyde 2,1-aminomutase